MYAKRFRATEHPDAPQGSKTRMTHPAPTFAAKAFGCVAANVHSDSIRRRTRCTRPAPIRNAPGEYRSADDAPADNAIERLKSTFYDRVEIFLEIHRVAFHYSVIGGDAKFRQAPGLADCHLLNDDVSASSSRGATAGAWAPAGDERRFNQVDPGRVFEPIRERSMRMIAVSQTKGTSISRSQISE
jgi:hypothetical protein